MIGGKELITWSETGQSYIFSSYSLQQFQFGL